MFALLLVIFAKVATIARKWVVAVVQADKN
jgi:hypothetical protein